MSGVGDLRRGLEERAGRETLGRMGELPGGEEAIEDLNALAAEYGGMDKATKDPRYVGAVARFTDYYFAVLEGREPHALDRLLPAPLKPEDVRGSEAGAPPSTLVAAEDVADEGSSFDDPPVEPDTQDAPETPASLDTAYLPTAEDYARPLEIPNTNSGEPPPWMDLQRPPGDRWPT